MEKKEIKSAVKKRYAGVALGQEGCCGTATSEQPGGQAAPQNAMGKKVGYSDQDLGQVPEGANLGLGCGNPVALASLKPGEVVLDLGSGAGFDSFLAAARVGDSGKVIGVDMTPEMLDKARGNAEKGGYKNVEFRQGEIENLPVEEGRVDVILSNCVINLSPDKSQVFREAFRVLKPGGRLMVSDLVLTRPLPEAVEKSIEAYTGCIAGALLKEDYLAAIRAAGFSDVEIQRESIYPIGSSNPDETEKAVLKSPELSNEDRQAVVDSVVSISVLAVKS